MKKRWLITLFAFVPITVAILALQSCAGVGGPVDAAGGSGTGGTSVSQDFLALLSAEQKGSAYVGSEACGDCHGGRADDPIYAHWKDTKHYANGVGCESCHGPGGAHKANPTKANILTTPNLDKPVVCAQCHGPINEQFGVSQHSKLIQDPVEEAVTNPAQYGRNSRCIACHSSLARLEVSKGTDLGTLTDAQINEICENTLTNVAHSATCVSCHNPHAKTGNLNQNGEDVQLWKKSFNTDTTPVGPASTAASFTTYDHICAQCHNGRGVDPTDAKLTSGTARPSMHDSNQYNMLMGFGGVEGNVVVERNTAHANAPGQCTKCHMPDSRHTFTVSYDKGCAPCHTSADAAARATSVKSEILNGLIALKARMEAYAKSKFGDADLWEYTTNITALGKTAPDQKQVAIELKRARHNYYFIVRSGDYGVHNAPYARTLLKVANTNLTSIGVASISETRSRQDALAIIEADRRRANEVDRKAD